MYHQSDAIEKAVIICVSLLKHQNLESLSTLKNLLTFIPNPSDVQEVWRRAINEIINTSPQTSYWLFEHPNCLKPEVNVREIMIQKLSQTLLSWGLSSEEFYFNSEGKLEVNHATRNRLITPRQVSHDEAIVALIYSLLEPSPCYHE